MLPSAEHSYQFWLKSPLLFKDMTQQSLNRLYAQKDSITASNLPAETWRKVLTSDYAMHQKPACLRKIATLEYLKQL